MENLLGKDFQSIERIYDMKGSTKGREVKLSSSDEIYSKLKVLKDLNYIQLNERLNVSDNSRERLIDIIESDAKFLASNNLMDYSLLFIKIRKDDENDNDKKIKRMPALVRVKGQGG
jgi:hypothetical protein